jgi:hypothetical protein
MDKKHARLYAHTAEAAQRSTASLRGGGHLVLVSIALLSVKVRILMFFKFVSGAFPGDEMQLTSRRHFTNPLSPVFPPLLPSSSNYKTTFSLPF